tara:strand:+ start:27 stop:386 length:360 start_codon:yes stop_codon:yes gene_type:complete
MKRYLFIISRAPYGSSHAFEQLEAAMVAAAFDGEVHILLRDEAVWCLQVEQNGAAVAQKTLSKVLSALPSFEIEQLHACERSVASRGVGVSPEISVGLLSLTQQTQLIGESDIVIGGQS